MKLSGSFVHQQVSAFKFGSSPFGRPKMFVYVYFIDGLLIDTGHSNMAKEVLAATKHLAVEQVYLTHHHEDHTGNVNLLQNHFNCPIFSSKLCAEIMLKPLPISLAQHLTWGKASAYTNIKVKEGFINSSSYTFEIIPIPGHAIDMVCLLEKNEGWLFSADLWVNDYIKYFMRNESMVAQIESLKKIVQLDFEFLFCAHNPQLENAKKRLENKLAFFQDFYGQAAHLYKAGNSEKQIFKQMGLKEKLSVKWLSGGGLSTINMVRSVIRDEQNKL